MGQCQSFFPKKEGAGALISGTNASDRVLGADKNRCRVRGISFRGREARDFSETPGAGASALIKLRAAWVVTVGLQPMATLYSVVTARAIAYPRFAACGGAENGTAVVSRLGSPKAV